MTVPEQFFVRQNVVIFLIVLLAAGLRISLSGGTTSADDLHLANESLKWLNQGFHIPERHLQLRIGLSLPLAAVFSVFGVGAWQMAVIPMLSSMVLILTSAYIARYFFGPLSGLLAALAVAVFPLDVFYSTRFYSDIPFGAASAAAIALFLKGRDSEHPALFSILSGLLWGYAYLIKIEAALLGIVYLVFFIRGPERKYVLYSAAACLAIVMTENVFYWVYTDQFLYRLRTIVATSTDSIEEVEDSARSGEYFTYLKSWFVTFYSFGLHYYLALLGVLSLLIYRPRGYDIILSWIAVMVLWLHFGGNPFSENYVPKTKLQRYSSYITAPVMVAVGYGLAVLYQSGRRYLGTLALVGLVAAGLFFSVFGMASAEREIATKTVFRRAAEHGYTPLYMDSSSHSIAAFLARSRPQLGAAVELRGGLIDPAEAARLLSAGAVSRSRRVYALVNRRFVEYHSWRYVGASSARLLDRMERCGDVIASADNPLPAVIYAQVSFLTFVGSWLPVVGDGVRETGEDVLEGDDAVILSFNNESLKCLVEAGGEDA